MTRYQFALIRYVHDISSGEFVNVGAVLLDLDNRRLYWHLSEKSSRLASFFRPFDSVRYLGLATHTGAVLATRVFPPRQLGAGRRPGGATRAAMGLHPLGLSANVPGR